MLARRRLRGDGHQTQMGCGHRRENGESCKRKERFWRELPQKERLFPKPSRERTVDGSVKAEGLLDSEGLGIERREDLEGKGRFWGQLTVEADQEASNQNPASRREGPGQMGPVQELWVSLSVKLSLNIGRRNVRLDKDNVFSVGKHTANTESGCEATVDHRQAHS